LAGVPAGPTDAARAPGVALASCRGDPVVVTKSAPDMNVR
jgi:hypothetical protein